MRRRFCAVLAAIGLAMTGPVALSGPASAQSGYGAPPPRYDAFDPFDFLDGSPDTLGCMKDCVRDFSPCDPPMFKRTDGRCKHTHGS